MTKQKSVPIFVIRPKITPLLIVTKPEFIIPSLILVFFHLLLAPFLITILYLLIQKSYKNAVYEFHKDYLIKKTNLIISNELIIQYKSILDITKSQNPIQAKFHLHTLIIRLAGDHHGCRLENIENAQTIADFIYKTKN